MTTGTGTGIGVGLGIRLGVGLGLRLGLGIVFVTIADLVTLFEPVEGAVLEPQRRIGALLARRRAPRGDLDDLSC